MRCNCCCAHRIFPYWWALVLQTYWSVTAAAFVRRKAHIILPSSQSTFCCSLINIPSIVSTSFRIPLFFPHPIILLNNKPILLPFLFFPLSALCSKVSAAAFFAERTLFLHIAKIFPSPILFNSFPDRSCISLWQFTPFCRYFPVQIDCTQCNSRRGSAVRRRSKL